MAQEEEIPEFELGDRVYIEGGRLDQTRGRIYFIGDALLRILPDGVSDRLIDISLVDGDFPQDLGIENFYLVSKRAKPAFVAQIDAQAGQKLDSFGPDGSLGIQYTVKEVNEAGDYLVLLDETGGELRVECNFKGIPADEPFVVLRPRQAPDQIVEGAAAPDAEEEVEDTTAENAFEELAFEDIEAEAVPIIGLVEREAKDRMYPDRIQRDEMFRSMLDSLSIRQQKSPKFQKEIRQFVEQAIILRNTVVKYDSTGDPIGRLLTSFQTISELLEKADIPLARPVLQANRTLYLDAEEGQPQGEEGEATAAADPIEAPGVAVNLEYLDKLITESNDFLNSQLGGTAGLLVTPDSLPQWYYSWEIFFERFMKPWSSSGAPGEVIAFQGDKEFFRAPIPTGIDAETDGLPLPETPLTSKEMVTASLLGKVRFGLQKGLAPRSTRLNPKKPLRKIESGDQGVIKNNLIFPLAVQRDLGLTRSGLLLKDIIFGYSPPSTMLEIFKRFGGISEETTTGSITCIGPEGSSQGDIGIDDWLKQQPLRIKGLGDALVEVKNLGLTARELTVEQQAVLVEKIQQLRALVKGFILNKHVEYERLIAALRIDNNPFLQGEALEELLAIIVSEPQLQPRVEELGKILPVYKGNDIATVAGICVKMSDLFLTAMAGVPASLARERNRTSRDTFMETLRQTTRKMIKRENAGQEPQPIQCPHTRSLQEIRKVKEPNDRIKLFAKFLARFQGPKKGNWITCAASPRDNLHNLVCYHEILLLQEYLHPREKDTIHKELLLAFSGGVFHGKYICKNCGQPISQIDYDQNIEFDDNGRPMSGRAALVDTDEIASEEFQQLLGAPIEGVKEAEFANDTQAMIYKTAKTIFDLIGIYPDTETYAHILERVEGEVAKQPSREDYARLLKARAKAGKQEGKPLDYDILIMRIVVCSTAANVLIEVQTHVPDYIVRMKIPGCVAGFTGFPLGKDDDKTGLKYISCAVSSIQRNEAPWNMTGFLLQPNEKKRQEVIEASVAKMASEAVKTAAVQQLISVKRSYYEKLYGAAMIGTSIPEFILPRFKPVPYYVTPEEAMQDPVIPEAATETDTARGWIQMAHRVARESGKYVKGSPYSETTSCYTSIREPRGFWAAKEATFPTLPAKKAPYGQSGSQVTLPFKPRKVQRLLAEPPEELFYRVFLRVCYDGPRKGLPHEPGLTHGCYHCGFVFPEDPYSESPAPPLIKELYKTWQTEVEGIITKGKTALESQKVPVTKDTFQDVLDTTHLRYTVKLDTAKKPFTGVALLDRLRSIEPPPFEGWVVLMSQTIERVMKMTPTPSVMEVADAYGPMSDFLAQELDEIGRRVGEISMAAIRDILKQSPSQIVESIRAYFLIPFKRLLQKYNTDSLKVPSSYKLPPDTKENIQNTMSDHFRYLKDLGKLVKGFTSIKLEHAKKQLDVVLPIIQKEIRSSLVPGGAEAVPYILGTIIIGILGEFINPNMVPFASAGGEGGAYEPTARVPIKILEVCLSRLNLEGLNLSEEAIRDIVSRRIEAEKMVFINKLDKMTPEEKKVELMKKRLGLGDWSVGGTKAIYSLDPEQIERERLQRIEMGVGDFVRDAGALEHAQNLLREETFGGGGEGAEGGYDNAQMEADDY